MSYMEKVNELKKENLFINNTEIAYAIILEDILSGKFSEGEKINQEALAEKLNMSRSPVRDALQQLEKEGFVVKNKNGSFTIYKLNMSEYIEFTEFRTSVEQFAVYHAAKYAANSDLDEIDRNMKKLKKACEEGNLEKVLFYDYEFHKLIISASKNKYAKDFFDTYGTKIKFYLKQVVSGEASTKLYLETLYTRHYRVFECLMQRDEVGAKENMMYHLEWTYKNLLEENISTKE